MINVVMWGWINFGVGLAMGFILGRLVGQIRAAEEMAKQMPCPRCGQPHAAILLGRDGEGHICGSCWERDRREDALRLTSPPWPP
jgi:hypothetical protein